ncbi:glucose 1-dehydrogenase [Mycobacterium senriense]|uniref:3-alpha-hydroxysteroid dehydrogenase n=1 Tax=Mycobacterium senriense TaxID=2775496 RepID=A0ABN6IKI0_9MYCO|nr:glucose 1-dehydrogenase [Mycobacterium senriense]BCZ23708.1 3-alpha-hydroxysteroid dehydrogenase [Mycobacterium senriense]
MGRVADKVVLVTGGARGMGAAHAAALAAEGAKVVIADVLEDEGRAVAETLGEAVHFVCLDVTDVSQWETAVSACINVFGGLDALVNNAGIVKLGSLRKLAIADWQQVLDVNLTGAFLGMRAVVEPMIARGGGSIVNISSVEGLAGSSHLHAYVAAKFGLRGITKSAAVELASQGIRVNSIHPGLVHTPMSDGVTEDFMAPIPMRRGADPAEVSSFVVFLVSDESTYATGAEFVVDGGLMSYVPTKV